MEDQIFISYRRDGGETMSMLLHDRLTAEGYRVFLDVESLRSGKFNTALLDVIEKCQDVLLVLPPNALDRCQDEEDWVRREIVHAMACRKNIIPIMMRGFEFPKNLPGEMADIVYYNGIEANMSLFPATMEKLMTRFLKSRPEGGSSQEVSEISLDKELGARFEELFGGHASGKGEMKEALSPVAKMIAERKETLRQQKYLAMMEKNLDEEADEEQPSGADSADRQEGSDGIGKETAQGGYHRFIDIDSDGTALVPGGKAFSVYDDPGVHTLAYSVVKRYDRAAFIQDFAAVPLDYEDEADGSGGTERTFYVEEAEKHGMPIVLLHFSKENEVAVNMGFLWRNVVKISKKPEFMPFSNSFSVQGDKISEAAVDLDSMTETERREMMEGNREVWWAADLDSSNIIIDPDTVKPVLREPYYDSKEGKWKAKIKIRSGKRYFAFQIRVSSDGPIHLKPQELGLFYRTGAHGFPKDPVKAAGYLEQDGSAEALYQIARIFLDETELQDKELSRSYLEQAAGAGCDAAKIELALSCSLDEASPDGSERYGEFLSLVEEDNDVSCFAKAYGWECGIFGERDLDQAFEGYCQSAMGYYMPAMLRLGCWEEGINEGDEQILRERFLASAEEGMGSAKFCLGIAHLYGQGISVNRERGLKLMEEAAKDGCAAAGYELARNR